jgi:DNA invertase Pin-like site-specific DNA recombinase
MNELRSIQQSPPLPGRFRHEKIQGRHLERWAVVYVRQSTLQQVRQHQESGRLQYGLKERAVQLGWSSQHVIVIDEDQGQTGTTAEGRQGFQRLVAEVGLDHVGIILGIEMSRLARCGRDWHHLLEICALFGTLLGDADGIYDPNEYNDRLVLGLKGTMSEAELHILKQRMLAGKRAKARRGELGMSVPIGYVRRPSGEVIKDPDEEAQFVTGLVFETFERCRTIDGVLRYLVQHDIRMPVRVHCGPEKGTLRWSRPNRQTLQNMLHNPIYAGAYVYGRRPTDPRRKKAGRPATGRLVATPEEWEVCLKDRLPAYITWPHYERNLRQLAANRTQALGVVRNGPSLLAGVLTCGRCGKRMTTHYSDNGRGLRYACTRLRTDYGGPHCQSLSGKPLDELVTALVFKALQPAALKLSLNVAEEIEAERAQLLKHWEQRLERSRYEVERAFRQYNAVEPENRLVARQLERHWEEALHAEAQVKVEYERFVSHQPLPLSAEERATIWRFSENIPALWYAPTTTASERQAIVRLLIERVTVSVQGDTEQVAVEVHWTGGHQSQATLIRPVARMEQLRDYPELLKRVAALFDEHKTPGEIARMLNEEGWRPPKRRDTFNGPMVRTLLSRQGLRRVNTQRRSEELAKRADEWRMDELAHALQMPEPTLYSWIRKGRVRARLQPHGTRSFWLIWADDAELERLRTLRNQPRPHRWSKHLIVHEDNDHR